MDKSYRKPPVVIRASPQQIGILYNTCMMITYPFSLVPFPRPDLPALKITGTVSRQKNLLTLHYVLSGEVEKVVLPARSVQPGRRDELWKMTCFEFFLALKSQPQYWEFNLSPSGDWNVYHMDAYRRIGFREEMSIQHLLFEASKEAGSFTLDVTTDLSPILGEVQTIEAGVTAVIQALDGKESYWALAHPVSHADFHVREGFTLVLAGQNHPASQPAPEK